MARGDFGFAELSQSHRDLLTKAHKDNDSLTDDERAAIFGIDVLDELVLKTYANPKQLTEEERMEVLGWPSEKIRNANVVKVTGDESMTFDKFVDCAAKDIGWLDYEKLCLIRNEYNILADNPTRYHIQRYFEDSQAQHLLMTPAQKQAFDNAQLASIGGGMLARKKKMDAGELDEAAVREEQRLQSLGKARCEQDLRAKFETSRYMPPRSDVEIYALRYLKDNVEREIEDFAERTRERYGFVIYRASEVRDKFEAEREQLLQPEFRDGRPTGFLQRLIQSFNGEDWRDTAHWTIIKSEERERAILEDFPASCEFLWSEHMRYQFETWEERYDDEPNPAAEGLMRFAPAPIAQLVSMMESSWEGVKLTHVGKVFRELPLHAKNLQDLIKYQRSEFEASQTNPDAFREDFRRMGADSRLETGMHKRYFLVCTPDGVPSVGALFKNTHRCTVGVYDADWAPPAAGEDKDEDGYQGMIKTSLHWSLYTRLWKRLEDEEFNLKEAWTEMQKRGPDEDGRDVMY